MTRLLLLPVVLGLAACRTDPDASSKTPAAEAPAVETPGPAMPPAAPRDTAAPVTPPASGEAWTIRADGAGPLRVGMTSAEASAATGQRVVPDTTDFGAQCAYTTVRTAAGDSLAVMFSDGRVVRVEPGYRAPIRSAEGFGAGTAEAEVRARYPRLRAEPHVYVPGGKYLFTHPLADTTLQVVYETDDKGVVTDVRGGKIPFVGYVEGCA